MTSDPIYVLAPVGRDSAVIVNMVRQAGIPAEAIEGFDAPGAAFSDGAGLIVAAEAFECFDASSLHDWLEGQPPWSDFPIVFLRSRDAPVTPQTQAFIERLGNVTILERPLHPITLLSAARTAIRARGRQREAEGAADLLERRVGERTSELAAANRQLLSEMAERERVEETIMRMQRLEAVGQLTAGVAHDFNNLLTVVLGNLARLEQHAPEGDQRRIAMMRIAAERGAKLTSQLLAFSRRQRLEPKAVSLNDAILSLSDLLQSTLGAAATLKTKLEPAPWPALVDPTQIEMIILNLAINARDAMKSGGGGVICLETENVVIRQPRTRPEAPEPGEYVMLCVGDNGSGMDEAVVQRVFEPFFTTKEVGRGSGLGLSQVLGFCKQSGGGVRIETTPGQGTRVCVYLPRAQASAQRLPTSLAPQALEETGLGGTVLLVDDDEAVRETTAQMLQDLGCEVVQVGSGGAALEVLDGARKIDLLLVDFAMPGMNGADVAKAAGIRRPGLPILFVSGYADLATMASIGHRVIRKPFEERDLAAQLASVLNDQARPH